MATDRSNPPDASHAITDIAIIGMACRFPGADNPAEFWTLLREGREASRVLSDDELRAAGVPQQLLNDPDYVKSAMPLRNMEYFDPGFFGFSPMDARILDPQHRQFLECTWEALEDAAYDPFRYDGSIGIFAGSGHNAYLPYNLLTNAQMLADVGLFLLRHTGNDKDFLTTRASYCFDLKGPSINVQTACSTSLVAVHLAAQSLLNGECDIALAGGVTIELPHNQGYLYKESEILSRDGHCRPFDASAGGTVFGSGVGMVVLKRLDHALADRDNIHAVLKASAVNNDGAGKVSYLAPSVDGQADSIHEALLVGEIDPRSVTYIETHGTGTQLGDPIEVAALTRAYGADNPQRQYCGIGSVKSNIGHLDTAAGVASMIKVILALKHRKIPATLHYRTPNASVDFSNSPFYVNAELREWNAPSPLRGGVSSLGVGGTNAHVILEEAPQLEAKPSSRKQHLLVVSARTDSALSANTRRLADFLRLDGTQQSLENIGWSLTRRRSFRKRAAFVVGSHEEAAALLEAPASSRGAAVETPEDQRQVAFMFAGGGAQYPNMGRDLYEQEPVYRKTLDECLDLLASFIDFEAKSLLFPRSVSETQAAGQLQRPSRSLPLLFATQYAQAKLWQSWGVSPSALIGHSMGENTAACLSGVISLRDALGLVALRGRLFETLPEGGMLSVNLPSDDLVPLLRNGLSIAARNAPELSVVSGPLDALSEIEAELTARDISCQRIRINVAAHSGMVEPILRDFGDYLRSIKLKAPALPFISNLRGTWITKKEPTDPGYWVRHLRETVRFAEGAGTLLEAGRFALLEVGPGRTLASLSSLHDSKQADHTIATSLRHPEESTNDLVHMMEAFGRLWQGNVDLDWNAFFARSERLRVSLPTYAFDHARYWVEPGTLQTRIEDERKQLGEWFHVPVWSPLPASIAPATGGTACLIGMEKEIRELRPALALRFTRVIEAAVGEEYTEIDDLSFHIADRETDFRQLVESIAKKNGEPVHFYLATGISTRGNDAAAVSRQLMPLFHLARALSDGECETASLLVITRSAMRLPGETESQNYGATALSGALRVVASELQIAASLVDLPGESGDRETSMLSFEQPLLTKTQILAYRSGQRLQLDFQETALPSSSVSSVRDGGVYLITGGMGGIGLTLAKHLTEQAPVKLALLGRRLPPAANARDFYRSSGGASAWTLDALEALEKSGAAILMLEADVADRKALENAVEKIESEWGSIHGVFHTAGVLADALIPMTDAGDFNKVLEAKVEGTINLTTVFSSRPLDFLMLFSSTSALAGIPGQFVYAAANAFMDGFAQARTDFPWPITAVSWAAWREVGMTAALARSDSSRRSEILPESRMHVTQRGAHFLLDGQDWVLAEHRTRDGVALLPGTGFLELAHRASDVVLEGPGSVVLRDVFLSQPLVVASDERLIVSVIFERDGQFSMYSSRDADAADRNEWLAEHAQGRAERQTDAPGVVTADESVILSEAKDPLNTSSIVSAEGVLRFAQDDTRVRGETFAGGRIRHAQMDFGPRWHCVQSITYGNGEAEVTLRLRDEFGSDLIEHRLHPALLDMATGPAQGLIPGFDPQLHFYVPQSYDQVTVYRPLERELVSRILVAPESSGDRWVLDVLVTSSSGEMLCEIRGFTMRRVATDALRGLHARRSVRPPEESLLAILSKGIRPEEGMQAIDRLLANPGLPSVVVSPSPAAAILERPRPDHTVADIAESFGEPHDRPAVSTEYVPPKTDLEKKLASLWQEGLGIGAVGLQDDFFELGGHSLLMIQLVNRAKKQAGVHLPLAKLYARPTIAGWVELLGQAGEGSETPGARPALKRVAREAYRTGGNG